MWSTTSVAPGATVRTRTLLACGIAYAVFYAVTNDLIAASLYPGYSRTSQAISELSAIGAPTRAFLTAMLPIGSAILVSFGIGVWRAAGGRTALRVAGAAIAAHGVTTVAWLPFPMTSRADMVAGAMPGNDVGHIVLTVATVSVILLQLVAGAVASRSRFRWYSVTTAIVVLAAGALTGLEAPKVPLGEPTPWMGLLERISVGAWLLWLAALAVTLRQSRDPASRVAG